MKLRLFVLSLLLSVLPLARGQLTITGLDPLTSLADGDLFLAVDVSATGAASGAVGPGGTNKSVSYATLKLHLQPLDADLTALAALAGTNTIYYRSAANTWTAVTIGSGLSFAAGSLTVGDLSATYQPLDADLTTFAGITPSANVQTLLGAANYAAFKTSLSLGNVENTALSTWAGSTNITTLGTISSGTWNGSIVGPTFLGTGASITTKYLRGDGTWQSLAAGTGSMTTVKANGSAVGDADIVTLDFSTDFGVAETPDTEINFTIAAGITRDTEWDTEAEVQTAWGSVNILLATEVDTSAELRAILGDETGTGAAVFADSPTFTGTAIFDTITTTNFNAGSLVFEGATADAFEATLGAVDPTADRAINLPNASGTVGLAEIVVKATAASYTIGTTDPRELYGGVIYVTGAATITIPAVAAGASFTVITIGAVAVSVDPNAADLIYLDGTALSDGDKITNLSTAGDIAVFTYFDATGWHASTNAWTDGN